MTLEYIEISRLAAGDVFRLTNSEWSPYYVLGGMITDENGNRRRAFYSEESGMVLGSIELEKKVWHENWL